jgi:ribosome-binding factor A
VSHRLEKINELIQQELGKIILAEEEFGLDVLVTILAAQTSNDQHQCAVTLSVWPEDKGPDILKKLNRRLAYFQALLNKKMKVRPMPTIKLILNTDEATSQKIETLIAKLKVNGTDND